MFRTSLDATVASTLCLLLSATPLPAQTAKPVAPATRPTPHPSQHTAPQPTARPSALPQRQAPTATQSRSASPFTRSLPAQRTAQATPGQQFTRQAPVPERVGNTTSSPQAQPFHAGFQAQAPARQYQLPAASRGYYQIPSTAAGRSFAGQPGRGDQSSTRHYVPSRPVPAYSPAQVRGYQWQALRSYSPAASIAALRVGDIYSAPAGQQQDSIRAARWYAYAAHLGNVSAAYSLGQMYLAGEGVPADPVRGYALVSWAATNGDPEAQGFVNSNAVPPSPYNDPGTPLPPPPPPPPSPPPDNSTADGNDVIADILLGTVAVAGLAMLLGSSADDVPPARETSAHGVTGDLCATIDLPKAVGYSAPGFDATMKGCVH